jgi:hypothetical protein
MYAKVVGTIGLVFDIVGAVLVAIEVVKVYRGPISGGNGSWKEVGVGKQTPEYEQFEKEKRKLWPIGLACIVFGFILQIVAVALWIK